jgi:hypothetical protein
MRDPSNGRQYLTLWTLAVVCLLAACATPTAAPISRAAATQQTVLGTPVAIPPVGISLTHDFTPPTGKPDSPAPAESPGEFRLLTATSRDGLVFKPTGRLILDQANVPDLIMGDNKLLYLYFTGWLVGEKQNATAAAISPDFGQTWYFKTLSITGHAGDPDIVRLRDGTFRLYLTTNVGPQKLGIIYLDSLDGIHFGEPATAFSLETNVVDSTTFLFENTWHMFVLDNHRPEQWHATSADGSVFGLVNKIPFTVDGAGYIVSNGVKTEQGYRLYGFNIPLKNFRSFFSEDGIRWTVEEGIRLAFDSSSGLENQYIKDPAVIQLPDGSYLMVYVTRIP